MNTRISWRLMASAAAILLCGCVTTHEKYTWGTYDHSLYEYYKDPATAGELLAELDAIIKGADSTNAVVAPGIYGEYGYLLLQQGKTDAAINAFKQEEARWPESKVFMDHMIQVASSRTVSTSTKEH
jgi:hypothetical protein